MAAATTRIVVVLERKLLQRAERLRASTGESRNALVERALRRVLQAGAHERNVEQYVMVYRRVPDGPRHASLARRTASRALAFLSWKDE